MIGNDELRGQEYAALMSEARDLGRTAQLCWTGAAVAAAVLLSGGIGARNPGLMLPVEFCAAFGFYATVHARRQCRLIEGYVQEYHEKERDGAQWYTRLAHLKSLPGFHDRPEWLPLALANLTTFVAVVFGWVFADAAAHGELMAGLVTAGGVAFSVHSIVENMHLDFLHGTAPWGQMNSGLREVTGGPKRVGTSR
jgi:hypothetical protein